MGTTETQTFVIVGGGLAAAEAAKTLRTEGYDGRLVVVAEEPQLPYERPPLTKEYLRGESAAEQLLFRPATFYEESRIEVLAGRRATRLDPATRSLTLDDGSVIVFDRLLLATGARAMRPSIPGINEPWVHVLRTIADADRLREAARAAGSVVVAGGGWIAAESAASLRQMGVDVTLVVPGQEVLERHVGAIAGRMFTELHERHGVRVVRGARVVELARPGGRTGVRLGGGDRVACDLAVAGLGASPAVELAAEAGLEVDDGIVADERLMTRVDGIYVAGDVASAWHPRYGHRVRSEHWDNARRQGRAAAHNMLGGAVPYDRLPYFYSDQFDLGMELFGRPAAGDRVHVRREDPGLVVAWTSDGRVVSAMHANVPDRRKTLERLVSSQARIDAARFADPGVPLEAVETAAFT
jgi:3-phenylpropionate/trans-cinnamate dioxygenase ferredoxin reductase component